MSLAESEANRFEGTFWSGGDLGKLYREIGARNKPVVGIGKHLRGGLR